MTKGLFALLYNIMLIENHNENLEKHHFFSIYMPNMFNWHLFMAGQAGYAPTLTRSKRVVLLLYDCPMYEECSQFLCTDFSVAHRLSSHCFSLDGTIVKN